MGPGIHLWCIQKGLIILISNLILFQIILPQPLSPHNTTTISSNQAKSRRRCPWMDFRQRKKTWQCLWAQTDKTLILPSEMRPSHLKIQLGFSWHYRLNGPDVTEKKSHYYNIILWQSMSLQLIQSFGSEWLLSNSTLKWSVIFRWKKNPCSIWKHHSNIRQICSCIDPCIGTWSSKV